MGVLLQEKFTIVPLSTNTVMAQKFYLEEKLTLIHIALNLFTKDLISFLKTSEDKPKGALKTSAVVVKGN